MLADARGTYGRKAEASPIWSSPSETISGERHHLGPVCGDLSTPNRPRSAAGAADSGRISQTRTKRGREVERTAGARGRGGAEAGGAEAGGAERAGRRERREREGGGAARVQGEAGGRGRRAHTIRTECAGLFS